MTDGELVDIIEGLRAIGTDHADVEAKASASELPRRLWETLSAFANSAGGGVLLLGVDERDGFTVCGVRDAKKKLQDLASLCDQMQPAIRAQIRAHAIERKTVIVAEIPEVERAQKPCFYKGSGQTNGSFIRVADGNRALSPYEIQLMIASRGQPRDDEEIVEDAAMEDLDKLLMAGLAAEVRRDSHNLMRASDQEILQTVKAVNRSGRRSMPTLAGLLALGKHPQRHFPALRIDFTVYPTPDVGAPGAADERFLDNRRLEGSVAQMLDQAIAAVRHHMARKTLIRGADREDVWQYPETALREAIANALAHRDLSGAARGTPVQLRMFPDRLIISNPGGLFGPVSVSTLGVTGISAARNATLMRILEDAPGPAGSRPICENRGSGIGAMIHALRRAGMEPPRFEDRLATFQVTFPNASLLDDDTLRWLERIGARDLSETQQMALALLRHGPYLDNARYRQATTLDSRVATRELGDLVERGLIVQVGTRRWATYRLATGGSLRRDRRAEIVSLLRRRGELSRADIALALEISDAAARQWLTTLRREGHVEVTGPVRSPTVKYRVVKRPRKARR